MVTEGILVFFLLRFFGIQHHLLGDGGRNSLVHFRGRQADREERRPCSSLVPSTLSICGHNRKAVSSA